MRRIPSVMAALFLVGSVAAAQTSQRTEVGTMLGVTILSQSGTSITHVGVPGDGIQASPALYATVFVTPSVMFEPQLAFTYLSTSGSHLTSLGVAAQVGYLFSPSASGSPYLAANLAFQSISNGASVSGPAAGASAGYRFKVKSDLAVRFDVRYRRWFSDFKDLNEIGFGIGFGGLL